SAAQQVSRGGKQGRPHRCLEAGATVTQWAAATGLPRRTADASAEGVGPKLSLPGGGHDASDESLEGDLSGAGYRLRRHGCLPGGAPRAMVKEAERARRETTSGVLV